MMKLRTVKDLRYYLAQEKLSPERFSDLCGISNMTIRRWLKIGDERSIPQKYWPIFDQLVGGAQAGTSSFSFDHGFKDLEAYVHSLGKENQTDSELKAQADEKIASFKILREFKEKIYSLFTALSSKDISQYQRTLVLGAIVYFLNPIDLIPDATPMVGLLDDYSIITMVLTSLVKKS